MKLGRTQRWTGGIAVGLGVAVACTRIPPPPAPIAPANACPDHPCGAYLEEGGVACNDGVCVDPSPAPPAHLVLLVAVPVDAQSAPGLTFAIPFSDGAPDAGPTFLPTALNFGRYLVTPSIILAVQGDTNLGTGITSLPVHVTYRPLWPAGSALPTVAPDSGAPLVDAVSLGLALYPVEADAVPARNGILAGPSGGPDMAFATYVQAGVVYERTLAPEPPFDRTFPPDVNRLEFSPRQPPEAYMDDEHGPDNTNKTELTATVPTFDLSRADGLPLDGWTAYLRDATTKRPISPVKPLDGTTTPDGGLLLPTSHHPPPVGNSPADALTNAELVMAPPAVATMATAIFPAVAVLPRAETYAFVPHPATVQGSIAWDDGIPVSADIVFEAIGVYAVPRSPVADPGDAGASRDGGDAGASGDAGAPFPLQTQGFEYAARARAQPDIATGRSSYSIALPRGEYRVTVRPLDGASSLADGAPLSHAMRVLERFDTGQGGDPIAGPEVTIQPAPIVSGSALVADGRPLAGAIVEALPIHCARSTRNDGGPPPQDSPACMPRYAQTVTAGSDGSFALALDPGEYVVRVEPADGTRLPWVAQVVSVPGSGALTFRVPAPVRREAQLFGQDGIAVANAVVRLFTVPVEGPAVELGRAITDATGRFDMYIDPGAQ